MQGGRGLHSWKLTWKPKKDPIKTTVPLKWGYMGFHVSLGECRSWVHGFLRPALVVLFSIVRGPRARRFPNVLLGKVVVSVNRGPQYRP